MSRWIWFLICIVLGLVMLICGLLMPIHLRAVDASVIEAAGRNTPTLIQVGLSLAKEQNLGAAQLLLQAALARGLPEQEKLSAALDDLAVQHPELRVCGLAGTVFDSPPGADRTAETSRPEPVTEYIVRQANRKRALELLRASPNPLVQELLRVRMLTNTVVFAPSESASGQAFDAAIAICGLLAEGGHLSSRLNSEVLAMASEASRGRNSQPLEEVLLDVMSLGQRFNWGQLVAFVNRIQDVETLRRLTGFIRRDYSLPVLFCAVQLSGEPAAVAGYLAKFSQTGVWDLGVSLSFGSGGVKELLRREQTLHSFKLRGRVAKFPPFGAYFNVAVGYCLREPWLALSVKWFFYLAGGFLLAAAVHHARGVLAWERPLQVRGFHLARDGLFALGFLLAVVLLSEPYLAQESQKVEFPFRLRLPTMGAAVPAETTGAHTTIMNQLSLLTLLLFFVLQGLIYVACLLKLAEIRRQPMPARIKLKLLENEDHLFDAGLYLGFVGTIISLILVSLGVIKPSLMAAYSSTSFGIIFVSVFKIFHLRPLRRKLLLEVEAVYPETASPAAKSSFALQP